MNTYYSRVNKPRGTEQDGRRKPVDDGRKVFERLYNDGKAKEEKYLDY